MIVASRDHAHVGPAKSDPSNASHVGKYIVLKSGREIGVASGMDTSCSCADSNCITPNSLVAVSPAQTASLSSGTSTISVLENKAAGLSLISGSNLDKRPSQSMAKSRSEFFNLMGRKTSPTAPTNSLDSCFAVSSFNADSSTGTLKEVHSSISPCKFDGHGSFNESINLSDAEEKNASGNGTIYPDEEEAAFLRSLGWEENYGENECLTEEEINAFYLEYMNRTQLESVPKFSKRFLFPVGISCYK